MVQVLDAIFTSSIEAEAGARIGGDVASQQTDEVVTVRTWGSVVRAQRTALHIGSARRVASYG
jgi:hypothetical protein